MLIFCKGGWPNGAEKLFPCPLEGELVNQRFDPIPGGRIGGWRGADAAEGEVNEGQTQIILNGGPMVYTLPNNSSNFEHGRR